MANNIAIIVSAVDNASGTLNKVQVGALGVDGAFGSVAGKAAIAGAAITNCWTPGAEASAVPGAKSGISASSAHIAEPGAMNMATRPQRRRTTGSWRTYRPPARSAGRNPRSSWMRQRMGTGEDGTPSPGPGGTSSRYLRS